MVFRMQPLVTFAAAELKKREAKKVAGSRWIRAGKIASGVATLENCRKKLDLFRAPLLPDGRPDPAVTREIEKAAVAVGKAEDAQKAMQTRKTAELVDGGSLYFGVVCLLGFGLGVG